MTRITVARLPVDPGPAGWNAILPAAPAARMLEGAQRAEWLVIGAGFAGLSAAHRLSRLCPGDDIVVVEAARVASGPGGRNSGFMIDLPHDLASSDYGGAPEADRALTQDNRHAIAYAAQMAADFGLSDQAFAPTGKINGAASAKGHQHNLDYARHLAALGEPYELMDRAAMQALTGTSYYRSGLYTAGTAMIQPAAYLRGIAEGMVSNRLRLFENTPVTALERRGDWCATTPKGRVSAPNVILAVNGHLNSFGFLKNQLMHVFTYASMTRPLSPQEQRALGGAPIWGLTPADPMGTTVRRIASAQGPRIVVRNRFTYDPTLEVSEARIQAVAQDHDRAFAARFPMLGGVTMDYRWGGRLCLSRNNVSVVQELEPGLFAACCQNGLGTTRGTLSGILAAELATGTASPQLTRALQAPPPRKLPPAFVMKPAARAVLRWQERQAGDEL